MTGQIEGNRGNAQRGREPRWYIAPGIEVPILTRFVQEERDGISAPPADATQSGAPG
jgi:hypothetical protein